MDDSDTFQPVPARLPGAAHGNPDLPSTISLKWASTIAEIRTKEAVELATLELVAWFNNHRLLEPIGHIPPAEAEANHYRKLASQATAMAA